MAPKSMFKKPLLLLVILLAGLVLASCRAGTGTIPRGWSGGIIDNGILYIGSMAGELVAANITDGSRLWAVPLETPPASGGGFSCAPPATAVAIYSSPAIAGDLVYVGGYNGKIYAFASGKDKWQWEYPRRAVLDPIVGGLVVTEDSVYFGSSNGKVYALEADGLFEKWDNPFETGGKIWSTPAISEDTLYIGSFDKKLYALNTTDGRQKWQFATEGAIVATPVVDNSTVYIGSFDRYLYALDANDGHLKWKSLAENWFWAKPIIHNDTIYAANLDGKVYILDAETGTKLVEPFDLGSPLSSSPVLVGNSIIVATGEGAVYALDTGSNRQRLLVNLEEKVFAPLIANQGKVYLHTTRDSLYEIDAQSGAVREINIKE
ncbi:MAG: PQQ-like beta-propeller repeat protein [Chloroflexi bacterium]|nr:PQQ-like beta-propeller repeat protein [Chloroflexota bacterium]MBI3930794.1 PQQ-like beta-propeller repeat protein [Chloroflexota bacterium]